MYKYLQLEHVKIQMNAHANTHTTSMKVEKNSARNSLPCKIRTQLIHKFWKNSNHLFKVFRVLETGECSEAAPEDKNEGKGREGRGRESETKVRTEKVNNQGGGRVMRGDIVH